MKKQKSEIDAILENVADVILEMKSTPSELTDDPFDFYVQRVQSRLFLKGELFRSQVIQGYHTLMTELAKQS